MQHSSHQTRAGLGGPCLHMRVCAFRLLVVILVPPPPPLHPPPRQSIHANSSIVIVRLLALIPHTASNHALLHNRDENILALELDVPERSTYDIGPSGPDSRAQIAINAALWQDGLVLLLAPAGGSSGIAQPLHLTPPSPSTAYDNGGSSSACGSDARVRNAARPHSAVGRPSSAAAARAAQPKTGMQPRY